MPEYIPYHATMFSQCLKKRITLVCQFQESVNLFEAQKWRYMSFQLELNSYPRQGTCHFETPQLIILYLFEPIF